MNTSVARIGLGCVQFGIRYGIDNTSGQVTYPNVLRILESAAANGIHFLGTARNYGESEAVLGAALNEIRLKDAFSIDMKVDLRLSTATTPRTSNR